MAAVKREPGAVARRVAANVRALRTQRGMSTYKLSARLAELGWPIRPDGITKLEGLERATTVDDLVALAIALDCSPNRLLFPSELSVSRDDVQYGSYVVSEQTRADTGDMWRWADGEYPLVLRDQNWDPLEPAPAGTAVAAFALENAPHRFPDVLSVLARRGDRGEG